MEVRNYAQFLGALPKMPDAIIAVEIDKYKPVFVQLTAEAFFTLFDKWESKHDHSKWGHYIHFHAEQDGVRYGCCKAVVETVQERAA